MSDSNEKCFIIMPISNPDGYPDRHFDKVYEQIIKPAVTNAGYEPFRVDTNKISDSIIEKIFDGVSNFPMAVCDLSSRNPNVLYELGLRHAYNMPVVLIQDDITDTIFDVGGINTIMYKSGRLYEDVIEAVQRLTDAIMETKNSKGINGSIVKIAKTFKANFNDVEVSKSDTLDLELSSIKNDLKQTKYMLETIIYSTLKINNENNLYKENVYSKTRVYELAKKLNITNKDLVDILNSLNITVDSHMSILTPKDVNRVTKNFKQDLETLNN